METAGISLGEGGEGGWWGRGGGNRMKFRSDPFSLSKVIESSSWFSHIHSKEKPQNIDLQPV